MNSLTLFTDPHLGTRRAAHTTAASSKALRQALYDQAMSIVSLHPAPFMCLGDLFDKAFNDESTLVQGYNVASRCYSTLAGNHDLTNRSDTTTSLDALKAMGVPMCVAPDLSVPYFQPDGAVYQVPHHASNELFLQACQQAADHASEHRDGLARFLFIHCNYDFPMQLEDNTLNLPRSLVPKLLEAFDMIFIGHEHNPRDDFEGRVVVMGNTHPTSFSDISDKFIYHLCLSTAEVETTCVWSKAERYRELKLGQPIPDLTGVQFVDVVGSESVETAAVVNMYLQEIWSSGKDLLAVRSRVKILDALADLDTEVDAAALETLEDQIRKDLAGSDLLPVFEEVLAEVQQ